MLQILLNEEEKTTLIDVLQCCLSDLRDEIHHTDDFDFKTMLKNRRKVLMKILDEISEEKERAEPAC